MSTTVPPTNVRPFPAIKPGHRLVPAKVGRSVVYIECPNWCTVDHVVDFNHFAEDIDHRGATAAEWDVDCITRPGERILSLDAWLHADAVANDPAMRAAHIVLDDESTQAYLTPDMADGVADDLVKLAAKIREAARSARLHNQHAAEVAA